MPRLPRLVLAGQPIHLIQRGNNRVAIFLASAERRRYLQLLRGAGRRTGCAVHAYVLMTNHVHLLVTPSDARGPALLMQAIGRSYVPWFNARHGRTGTLWEGRYRSSLIGSEAYFLACSRYIELNPVRAGLVAQPEAHPWSSFRHNAWGTVDPLITPHPIYAALGARPAERQRAYRALFARQLTDAELRGIRLATNAGRVCGDPTFVEMLERRLRRRLALGRHGGDRRSAAFRARRGQDGGDASLSRTLPDSPSALLDGASRHPRRGTGGASRLGTLLTP